MDYLKNVGANGFVITKRTNPNKLPPTYIEFLNQFDTIINTDKAIWFNSIEYFNEESDTDYLKLFA